MLLIIGSLIVLVSVGGGYVLSHGHLLMLWQPYEMIIICGAALGGFVVSNSKHTLIEVFKSVPKLIIGSGLGRAFYMDLLSLMYDLFSKIRKEGMIAIEEDIEDAKEALAAAGLEDELCKP